MATLTKNKWRSKYCRKSIESKRKENKHPKSRSTRRTDWKTWTRSVVRDYVTENISYQTLIEWNNQPIVSPQNYSIATNRVVVPYPRGRHHEANPFGGRLDCIVCGQYRSSHQDLVDLDCPTCKDYVLRQLNPLYKSRETLRVCNNCAVSTDICRNDSKCTFCDRYAIKYECRFHNKEQRELFHPNEYEFIATQRTNKLHEPLQWRWRFDILTYRMNEPQYPLLGHNGHALGVVLNTKVDDQYLRVFCKHKCVTCDGCIDCQSQVPQGRCKFCGNVYCIEFQRDEGGWSHCGSLTRTVCRYCYYKIERDSLRTAIYEHLPQFLCLDLCEIVYEYSIGFVIQCSNYARCQQEFCLQSWLHLERYNWYDIDGKKTFTAYIARKAPKNNTRVSQKRTKKMIQKECDASVVCVDDRYYRVMCRYEYEDQYKHRDILQDCDVPCDCSELGRFSKHSWGGYHTYLCLEDMETECDVCCKKPFVKKTLCAECGANVCLCCRRNGMHEKYCMRIKTLNRNDYTMNDELMGYDFARYYREIKNKCFQKYKHVNKAKKCTRTMTKNKQKRSSYWKRRHDKSSNVKWHHRNHKRAFFFRSARLDILCAFE